ncbi:MAG TPA: phenylacetic acid degradation protein PaaN [Cryptosporangiaceae bacterium]|nr:phenylacetic acid degradation protein PaaN [Cryptosporangiaceae bacterium]
MTAATTTYLADRHRDTLRQAVEAVGRRDYWSAYPESVKAQPDGAVEAGLKAFESYLDADFPVTTPGADGTVATERSPYGRALGVRYPHVTDLDALLVAAGAGIAGWRDAGPDARAAVCLEILARLHARSAEIANAVMHTSGQAYPMAFQAGGPHAQDRGLEAVAYAYAEMTRHPERATWTKPQGKRDPLVMEKRFTVVPRGVALVIGCNTFPTWNSYPGLFASLVTGNAVVVKPHPRAVLPLAITVAVCREVLAEAGFSPDLVTLVAEAEGQKVAATLAVRPEVKLIDFTGSTAFGEWLEQHARQATVYTEKAGVNTVVVDSAGDYRGMLGNVAFSLSLYSGQMCTAPQNLLVPADGIHTDEGPKTFDEVVADLGAALDKLLGDDARAVNVLGALVNENVRERVEGADGLGEVAVPSRAVADPDHPDAVVRTPVVVKVDPSRDDVYGGECFGPVSFAVPTASTAESIELFRKVVGEKGALTALVYSTDDQVLAAMREAALEVGVALSENLTGGVFVNQSAAFSDFHGTGANPAANAALTDGAYVASRFRVVQTRRHA